MIYSFNVRNEFNEEKHFLLTADNHTQLYKRILSTYGVTRDNVELLAEYEETPDWGYKLVKSHVAQDAKVYDKDIKEKAKKAMADQSRMCEPWKSDYIARHKMTEFPIDSEKDLYPLIEKYKTVKVRWENGEKRGHHKYYALVK